jgi:hypothetical protein
LVPFEPGIHGSDCRLLLLRGVLLGLLLILLLLTDRSLIYASADDSTLAFLRYTIVSESSPRSAWHPCSSTPERKPMFVARAVNTISDPSASAMRSM